MDAANNLGIVYYKQEKLDEAIRIYQIALRSNPDALKPRFNLAQVYTKQGQYSKAKLHMELAYEQLGSLEEGERKNQQSLRMRADLECALQALGSLR